jgi:hypothetical protein
MEKPRHPAAGLLRALALAAILGLALYGYLALLARWPDAPAAAATAPVAAVSPGQTSLELSRRLSGVNQDAVAARTPLAAIAERIAWPPLLGFLLALCAGALATRLLPRRRLPAQAAGADQPLAHADTPPPAPPDAHDARHSHEASAPAHPADVAPDPADAQPDSRPDDANADAARLASALAARDQVIASLEAIVKENREKWGAYEQERDALLARVASLEAELQGAHDLIESAHQTARLPLPDDIGPQVLGRA